MAPQNRQFLTGSWAPGSNPHSKHQLIAQNYFQSNHYWSEKVATSNSQFQSKKQDKIPFTNFFQNLILDQSSSIRIQQFKKRRKELSHFFIHSFVMCVQMQFPLFLLTLISLYLIPIDFYQSRLLVMSIKYQLTI